MTTPTPTYPAPRVPRPRFPPACGACGYDTTGLTTLTCPECGSDLRVAGITRGPRHNSAAEMIGSVVALLVAWVICGLVLMPVVSSLVPSRRTFQQTVRLGAPRSGGYQGVDVASSGSGIEGLPPTVNVELRLVPLSSTAAPPAPLPVSGGTTQAGVLAWMAQAGVDTADPLVQEEAQAVAMAAQRAGRSGRHTGAANVAGSFFGGTSRTSITGRSNTPFGSYTTTSAGGFVGRSSVPSIAFGLAWVALLVAGILFLWRTMRPRMGGMTNDETRMTNQ